MAAETEPLTIREIFGFYVREDGKVVLSLTLDGESTVLTMEHDVAESIGMSFINAATKAQGVVEGRHTVTPSGFEPLKDGERPSDPVPWGPRRLNKTADKPN